MITKYEITSIQQQLIITLHKEDPVEIYVIEWLQDLYNSIKGKSEHESEEAKNAVCGSMNCDEINPHHSVLWHDVRCHWCPTNRRIIISCISVITLTHLKYQYTVAKWKEGRKKGLNYLENG